ncbi:S41 family peptidase [Nemorincola caseinilytica]|uniref:S41 family peptidase n=2 Tax=Nemorincola caseinilytica TaxID=2054315 RepID=A0ABP8N888_9BACT
MVLGFKLRDSLRNKRDISTIVKRNDRLEELIELIKERYVDTVNTDLLYQDAVTGILDPLDPHTVYISAEDARIANSELDGGFSGIGVEFSIMHDTVNVTSVTENGPAAKAGMVSGDQLIKVGDSVVAGTRITSERIMALLRGRQGSNVSITIRPIAYEGSRTVQVTRDMIPLYSVDANIMLDSRTGYIKVDRFSATTYEEFTKALAELKKEGATQLIVDLRDNRGGYLDAATSISDELLDNDKLIVSTRGRHTPRIDHSAKEKGAFESGKLIVLVNESSASASEVLAGAVQDWDRGLIIGRRTYGKGLVQEQYEMPDGAALRLTIARYYTPSGRSIQRSFSEGRDVYNEDLENRLLDGELTGKEQVRPADTTPYHTAKGRLVYGGGGITPDVYVPYDTARWSDPLFKRAFSDEMRQAIHDHYVRNRDLLSYSSIQDFTRAFNGEDKIISNYIGLLPPDEQRQVAKHITVQGSNKLFRTQIKAQLARYLFRDNGYYSIRLREDAMVNKALSIINGTQYDAILNGQRIIAQNK